MKRGHTLRRRPATNKSDYLKRCFSTLASFYITADSLLPPYFLLPLHNITRILSQRLEKCFLTFGPLAFLLFIILPTTSASLFYGIQIQISRWLLHHPHHSPLWRIRRMETSIPRMRMPASTKSTLPANAHRTYHPIPGSSLSAASLILLMLRRRLWMDGSYQTSGCSTISFAVRQLPSRRGLPAVAQKILSKNTRDMRTAVPCRSLASCWKSDFWTP